MGHNTFPRWRWDWLLVQAIALVFLLFSGCGGKGVNEQEIANAVKAGLFSDPDVRSANLEVSVKNGEVTLSGDVPSAEVQLKAFKIAAAVPGVTRVNDQMKVQAAQQVAEPPAAPSSSEPQRAAQVKPPPARASREPASPAAAESRVTKITVPSGTRLSIRMIDSIDSKVNQTGEEFRASLDAPVTVDGEVAIPRGSTVFVRLAEAKSAGRVSGQSLLELQLSKVVVNGNTYTLVSNSYEQKGSSRGKQTAVRTGIGAAAGAAIGAIAGGGKGAAIGAAVGGGGAAAYQILTRGKQVRIPSEALLDFTLQAPVTIARRS